MLVYKALYKKMMDDLKDAGMWIDWAEQLQGEHEEVARFLLESAKERLEESFHKTHEHFKKVCDENHNRSGICVDEMVYDHMMDWCHAMKRKIEHMEEKEYHS